MEYATLGKSDLRVSKIGLGAWQFGDKGWGWGTTVTEEDAVAVLRAAFDAGVNFIDTAEGYGQGMSEQVVGRFIKMVGREHLVIATKVSGQHLRYGDVFKAADASLSRLGISTIDLYQIHFPSPYVPLRQTMKALGELVDQEKIRCIGVSNFSRPLLEVAQNALSRHAIVSNQVRYNLLQREIEEETLPYCRREKIAIIAYSPLAQGLLTGKFETLDLPEGDLRKNNPLFTPSNLERVRNTVHLLRNVAEKYGKRTSQAALNWLLGQPDVFPIPGAKRVSQVQDNAGAVAWRLKAEDLLLLDRASSQMRLSYFAQGVF